MCLLFFCVSVATHSSALSEAFVVSFFWLCVFVSLCVSISEYFHFCISSATSLVQVWHVRALTGVSEGARWKARWSVLLPQSTNLWSRLLLFLLFPQLLLLFLLLVKVFYCSVLLPQEQLVIVAAERKVLSARSHKHEDKLVRLGKHDDRDTTISERPLKISALVVQDLQMSKNVLFYFTAMFYVSCPSISL